MYKILFLITSILIIVGTGSYFLFFQAKPIWTIETSTTSIVPTTPTYEESRMTVEEKNTQNKELYNTAMQEQNISMCTGISDENQKIECQDMIRATTAKKLGNIEACSTLTHTGTMILCKDVISADKAIASTNGALCDMISDRDKLMSCRESIDEIQFIEKNRANSITREFCDTLGDKYQSICLTQMQEIDETSLYRDAMSTNNIKLCEQITSPSLRTTCLDTIRLRSAVTTDNTTLCDTIADTDKRLYCQAQVSKTADIAVYKSAITGTDTGSCQQIVNENLRNKCNDTIIISQVKRNNDTSLCGGLTATGMITACRAIGQ